MHVEASFSGVVTFVSETQLRAAFDTSRLHLDPGAELTLSGAIRLGIDVAFAGKCTLTGPVTVQAASQLTNVVLGRECVVRAYSILTGVTAGQRNLFGPFCFLRDGVSAGDDCILGAHVEAARASFGSGVKVSHQAFIGDAEVADNVILGAGTTFCNFDGVARQVTRVGADVTVGSGSLLVAPLTIGRAAVIGAGSTITRDVPPGARVIQKRSPAL